MFLHKYKKLHGLPKVMRTIKILLALPNLSFLYLSFLEKDKGIWPLRLLDINNLKWDAKKKALFDSSSVHVGCQTNYFNKWHAKLS